MKPFEEKLAKDGGRVVTRAGQPARILCFDMNSDQPIVAAVTDESGFELLITYFSDGRRLCRYESQADLFMAPEKKYVVIGVCASDGKAFTASAGAIYDCKDDALAYAKWVTQQHAGTYQVVEIEA